MEASSEGRVRTEGGGYECICSNSVEIRRQLIQRARGRKVGDDSKSRIRCDKCRTIHVLSVSKKAKDMAEEVEQGNNEIEVEVDEEAEKNVKQEKVKKLKKNSRRYTKDEVEVEKDHVEEGISLLFEENLEQGTVKKYRQMLERLKRRRKSQNRTFHCQLCGKNFAEMKLLGIHIRDCHKKKNFQGMKRDDVEEGISLEKMEKVEKVEEGNVEKDDVEEGKVEKDDDVEEGISLEKMEKVEEGKVEKDDVEEGISLPFPQVTVKKSMKKSKKKSRHEANNMAKEVKIKKYWHGDQVRALQPRKVVKVVCGDYVFKRDEEKTSEDWETEKHDLIKHFKQKAAIIRKDYKAMEMVVGEDEAKSAYFHYMNHIKKPRFLGKFKNFCKRMKAARALDSEEVNLDVDGIINWEDGEDLITREENKSNIIGTAAAKSIEQDNGVWDCNGSRVIKNPLWDCNGRLIKNPLWKRLEKKNLRRKAVLEQVIKALEESVEESVEEHGEEEHDEEEHGEEEHDDEDENVEEDEELMELERLKKRLRMNNNKKISEKPYVNMYYGYNVTHNKLRRTPDEEVKEAADREAKKQEEIKLLMEKQAKHLEKTYKLIEHLGEDCARRLIRDRNRATDAKEDKDLYNMTDEEWAKHEEEEEELMKKYMVQLKESEGFDIYDFPHSSSVPVMEHFYPGDPELAVACQKALLLYNALNGSHYEFERVLKVNYSVGAGSVVYLITFQARRAGDSHVFQTRVVDKAGREKIRVDFCRLKRG